MKIKILLLGMLIAVFSACNSGPTNEQSDAEHHMDGEHHSDEEHMENEPEMDEPMSSAGVITEENLEEFKNLSAAVTNQLVNAYLEMKDALVNTDAAGAKKAAENAQEALSDQDGDAAKALHENIKQISSTESVEEQRKHFDQLSKHLYSLVKANENTELTLYKQYCPMAFDNTGAFWLSSSDEIRNPYFGDQMLKCGRVEETIE